MNAFAGATSGGIIGSYNAVNPVTANAHELITPAVAGAGGTQSNCSFTRPNGSTEGFDALDFSLNPTTTLPVLNGTGQNPPQANCISIARSSGGPGSAVPSGVTGGPGSLDASGNLVYIPFAVDAVTGATGPTTAGQTTTITTPTGPQTITVPVTNLTTADMFTKADLVNLYKNCATVTEGGVTYNPGTAATGQVQINLYVPQSGSGTLKFWASTLGFSATALPACVHQTIVAGPANTIAVEEHDGTAYASDPNGYGPFSIAQWVAQSNGHSDRRHTAIIHQVNAIAPTVSGSLNPNFPILREVYNVVRYDHVVNTGDGNFDATLAGLLAGSTSALCQSTFTIKSFGFGTLPNANLADACGATTSGLRVQETTAGPS
jgi:phosphate transport system substrate-binding protein